MSRVSVSAVHLEVWRWQASDLAPPALQPFSLQEHYFPLFQIHCRSYSLSGECESIKSSLSALSIFTSAGHQSPTPPTLFCRQHIYHLSFFDHNAFLNQLLHSHCRCVRRCSHTCSQHPCCVRPSSFALDRLPRILPLIPTILHSSDGNMPHKRSTDDVVKLGRRS